MAGKPTKKQSKTSAAKAQLLAKAQELFGTEIAKAEQAVQAWEKAEVGRNERLYEMLAHVYTIGQCIARNPENQRAFLQFLRQQSPPIKASARAKNCFYYPLKLVAGGKADSLSNWAKVLDYWHKSTDEAALRDGEALRRFVNDEHGGSKEVLRKYRETFGEKRDKDTASGDDDKQALIDAELLRAEPIASFAGAGDFPAGFTLVLAHTDDTGQTKLLRVVEEKPEKLAKLRLRLSSSTSPATVSHDQAEDISVD